MLSVKGLNAIRPLFPLGRHLTYSELRGGSFMKRTVIAIDQGTTGTTIQLVDEKGELIHKTYHPFSQNYPNPGWVEHDPEAIWESVKNGLDELRGLPGVDWSAVTAIGITNQRETVMVWDKMTGRPVYPAVVWQCRRTAPRCTELQQKGLESMIQEKTGLRIDPYFSATKLEWLLRNVEGLKERAERGEVICGTVDTWLIWKLTTGKVHATDYSNASRTMLFNIHTLAWDGELCGLFDIPRAILPEVRPSAGSFGEADAKVVGHAIPITGVLGDQQAALFGQGCMTQGALKNTYGTGCFLLMNTGDAPRRPRHGLLTTIAWYMQGKPTYALEGSVFVGGAAIQWLRDELKILESAAESEQMALAVPDTGGVYFVPAFTGLGAPHWDSYARGAILGLTRGSNRNHLIRAALEGMAFQVREVVDSMAEAAGRRPTVLRVDGGAAANNFLLQFQADLCDLTIQRNTSLELTGLGAAFIAGLGCGLWHNPAELCALVKMERTFEPAMQGETREKLWKGWQRAVDRAKHWEVEE